MTRLDPYLSDIMMVFLGIAMIFYGSLAFYSYSNETTESMLGLMLTGSQVIVIQGLMIIFDPNRNFIRSTVIFQFAIGLFRLLTYYQLFLDKIAGDVSAMKTMDYFLAGSYLILAALGLLMFISAVAIQMGFAFRRNSLMWTCIIQMGTSMVYLLYESILNPDFNVLIQNETFQLRSVEFALFMIVLYIFDSDEVRNGSTWGKHNVMIGNIRNGRVFDSNAFIIPSVAQAILDPEKSEWRVMMDCGPVLKEYRFSVSGRGYGGTEMLAQLWKDDECVHIISQGNLDTSLLFQHSMAVNAIYEKDGFLKMEGKDGTMISFAIREPTKEDYYAFLGTGA